MFHHFLAARGYTVLNVDYRGSAGYGRNCRTAIYKHMGGRDLDDIIDGAHYLEREHGVGAKQVGVYGGSYGGFLTLMAMFKYPKDIASGAALRSVTDWAHYNHGYTVRILGTRRRPGSVSTLVAYLFRRGTRRQPAHPARSARRQRAGRGDIRRLAQRLIELGKENWELALHPVERHGYRRASSWTDQMTRTYKLFARTLPAGAGGRLSAGKIAVELGVCGCYNRSVRFARFRRARRTRIIGHPIFLPSLSLRRIHTRCCLSPRRLNRRGGGKAFLRSPNASWLVAGANSIIGYVRQALLGARHGVDARRPRTRSRPPARARSSSPGSDCPPRRRSEWRRRGHGRAWGARWCTAAAIRRSTARADRRLAVWPTNPSGTSTRSESRSG